MSKRIIFSTILFLNALLIFSSCKLPEEEIVLRQIKDVLVDASTDPKLKANAIFFNPNKQHGKLKRINIDIYVNGKKAGRIDQKLNTKIPGNGEFTVPIEVNLNMKELGFLNTLMGVIGGKKLDVRYEGSLKVTYHGIPIKVPVKYSDEVRIKF